MSGKPFKAHRLSTKGVGSGGPDNYFQNAHLVPAPREENIYGGTIGSSATAAVTFSFTDNYTDEGVGGMMIVAVAHASAAFTIPAATISCTLYRSTETEDVLIATGQCTLPQMSANATVVNIEKHIDLPFTSTQYLVGNKVLVAGTLTPAAGVAGATLKVDLLKTGLKIESELSTNYLSAIASYTQSSNASLTAIDANASAIETLLTEIFSSIDTLILTATNSIRTEEIDPLDLHYDAQNLSNSASLGFTATSTTKYYDITMDGYGAIGFHAQMVASASASCTINVFGTMDRAADGGAEVYYNINQEIDSSASTAGWTIAAAGGWTLEDTSGVCGFFKKVRFAITETADYTWTINYKLKQLL